MRFRHFFLCVILGLCCACIDNRTVGPSTEEGNPQIVVMIVDSSNQPLADMPVTAYLMPTNTDTAAQPVSAIGVASTRTDTEGSCSFTDLPPGRYSIIAIDSNGNQGAIRLDIMIMGVNTETPVFSLTLALAGTGSISGIVTRNGVPGNITNTGLKDAFIQVKIGEIDKTYTTGPDGAYLFSNLPPGAYTLYYYATDGFYCAKREITIENSERNAFVETVILTPVSRLIPPKNLRAAYDTSSGIISLTWQKVQFDSLRWYEVERIDLSGPHDTIFTSTDTLYYDTVTGIPAGTVLDYVVRSVDKAFNRSVNAGPVEITVAP